MVGCFKFCDETLVSMNYGEFLYNQRTWGYFKNFRFFDSISYSIRAVGIIRIESITIKLWQLFKDLPVYQ